MEEIIVGIDVGTTKICTLVGRVEDNKTIRIMGVGIEPSEGIKKGIVSVLMRLLAQRFGEVPAWVSERLEAATPELLESWSGRLLEAGSLEEVFA